MSQPATGKRPGGRTAGTNTLITAASLALTLSGWAGLAMSEVQPVPPVVAAVPTETPRPALPAVPTLVPEPDWASIPAPANAGSAVIAPTAAAAAPARVAAPPAIPVRPPRPVAVTRSSR